ncbi:MAG: hypothetical protein KAS32_19905 [Candidatus Peribacteraceae bacterium]|nr:hypothetical protein [Candidatus Peribacteraceae bacterium]
MKKLNISSVRLLGKKKTYNLRMRSEHHNYLLGNGVVSKNSHATAYSLLSYWTMWFKVKYPLEFICAALQSDMNPEKRRLYIKEAIRLGINIAPPDVNISGEGFTIDDKRANTIRCGFGDIKGVGDKTVQKITAGAPYTSLKDFLVRCRVNKTVVSVMLQTGALDSICLNPCVVWDNLERVLKLRKKKNEKTQDKYWEEEVEPWLSDKAGKFVETIAGNRNKFTEKEIETFRIQFLSLPPAIHPAVPVRAWLRKNCKHIKFHEIKEYPDLFDMEFDTEHKAFVGVCTRVQFQNIATQLSPEERAKLKEELGAFADKMEGTERRVKLNLEDDTDFLMGMSSPVQYTAMDENKVKEGMVFLAIGSAVGDFRIKTCLFVNMTDMIERVNSGSKFDPGTQEYFLLNDPFKNWRVDIKKDKDLKPLNKKIGEVRSVVHIVDIQDIVTKKKKKMSKVTCMDWRGNLKDLMLWGDEYGMYRDRIEVGKTFVTFVYCKKQGDGYRYSLSLRSRSGGTRIKGIEDYF